jgi:hypothetical protein
VCRLTRVRPALFALTILGLSPSPALAGATVSELLNQYDQIPKMRPYIDTGVQGVLSGFGAANDYLQVVRHQPPIFCLPNTVSPNGPQMIDMLRRNALAHPEQNDLSFEAVLLFTLVEAFPCEENSN